MHARNNRTAHVRTPSSFLIFSKAAFRLAGCPASAVTVMHTRPAATMSCVCVICVVVIQCTQNLVCLIEVGLFARQNCNLEPAKTTLSQGVNDTNAHTHTATMD